MFPRLLFWCLAAASPPDPAFVLSAMRRADAHFRAEWPDPGKPIVTNRTRPSNIWTRAVYYEGLMALYAIDRDPAERRYAELWAEDHHWGLRSGDATRNADDQCCGQTYVDLYRLDPAPEKIAALQHSLSAMAKSSRRDDWSWVDAIQMALPAFTKLGAATGDVRLFSAGHQLFLASRDGSGTRPALFDRRTSLWWRDRDFVPPHRTPAGRDCLWSRGNGWVFAAMVRAIEALPPGAEGRDDYVRMLQAMAPALLSRQRPDGFWNCDLGDPDDFGGPEASGTALFAFGFAAGIRLGLLPAAEYRPAAVRAWTALTTRALHPDGFLGFVQGTGKQPSDSQPVTYDRKPDFDDFGTGCFLLAGCELYRLSGGR